MSRLGVRTHTHTPTHPAFYWHLLGVDTHARTHTRTDYKPTHCIFQANVFLHLNYNRPSTYYSPLFTIDYHFFISVLLDYVFTRNMIDLLELG